MRLALPMIVHRYQTSVCRGVLQRYGEIASQLVGRARRSPTTWRLRFGPVSGNVMFGSDQMRDTFYHNAVRFLRLEEDASGARPSQEEEPWKP